MTGRRSSFVWPGRARRQRGSHEQRVSHFPMTKKKDGGGGSAANQDGVRARNTGAASSSNPTASASSGSGEQAKSKNKPAVSPTAGVTMTLKQYALSITLAIVVGIAIYFIAAKLTEEKYPKMMGTHTLLRPVEREVWDPSRLVAATLMKGGVPKILTNTFAEKWIARKMWRIDGEYLKQFIPRELPSVYKSKNRYFGPLYRPNKPLAKLPTVRWGNPHEVVTMNTNKFFDQINGRIDSNGTYLYYTGDLSAPTLAKDLEPWRDLIPRVREQRVNVWVSQRGVVTHLHLDSYENFFVQLDGRKRMLLFPPNQEFNAPLYPFMHPSFGQAQPNITADDKARQLFTYKNLKNLTGYEAILGPGDMMYIPPNWFHHVEALDPCISVNFWSASIQQSTYDEAIKRVVNNMVHEWTYAQKRTAATLLIHGLINSTLVQDGLHVPPLSETSAHMSMPPPEGPNDTYIYRFLSRYVFPRYEALARSGTVYVFPQRECKMNLNLTVDVAPVRKSKLLQQFGLAPQDLTPEEIADMDKPLTNALIYESMGVLAENVAELFGSIKPIERPIWIANFVEALSFWSGNVDGTEIAGILDCIARARIANELPPVGKRSVAMQKTGKMMEL